MSDTVKLNNCPKCGAPIPVGAPQGLCPKCVLLGAATATDTGVPATATSEIPSLARVAAAFPQLEILELIGRGGMGFVFKARQPHLDRFVALKLLPDKLARDPRFAERFNREGRVLAKLNHPNIVSVYDFGQTEHFYFLMMEFVDGVNLRQAMHAGRFSPGEALAIVPKICDALQYAHGQGILHRDIKPENILLDARGQVKIADFGIAKLVGEDHKADVALTATGAALGTPHYMAPEQLEKPLTVDHRADIYSLGVVFYEMLTGELPIGRFAAPSSKTPVGANVDEVVFRTLEKDRERRYQSAGEMKTQVEHLTDAGAGGFQATPPKLSGAETVVAPKWSHKAVWGAVLTGLSLPLPLLLLVLAYLAKGGRTMFGVVELIIFAGMTLLPGLAGTILGWMALSDIRAQQGRLRGLPLAVFATMAWPALILLGGSGAAAIAITQVVAVEARGLHASLLLLLIPAGLITFTIWSVYAAAHWGGNKPAPQRHSLLKWVLTSLFIGALFGPSFLRLAYRPAPPEAASPVAQVVPVEPANTVPWIDFTITRVELREEADPSRAKATKYWLNMDYLADVHGAAEKTFLCEASIPGFKAEVHTGEKVSDSKGNPVHDRPLVEFLLPPMTENASQVYDFRTRVKEALEHRTFRLAVGEEKVLFEIPNPAGDSLKGRVKVVPPLKMPAADNTPPWIRFTFTAVELREVADVRWLAIDYVDDVHGDCQKSFPWETTIPGFKAETRATEFRTDAKDSSPAVRHQRIEYRMPDSAPREQLETLRENLAKVLIQKSIRLDLGEQQVPVLLFELPLAEGGALKAWVKVMPPLIVPAAAAAQTGPNSLLEFGPVEERTLADAQAIALSSGRINGLPASLLSQRESYDKDLGIGGWMARAGQDFAHVSRGQFYGSVQNITTLTREEWDTVGAAQLAALLHPAGKVSPVKFEDRAPRKYTYGFKTAGGQYGFLQIMGFTENPPGVKIRYKLAQGAATPSAIPVSAQIHSFGPVVVRTLSFDETLQDGFLDLDTGRLLTPPKDIAALFKTAYGTRLEWERKSDPQAIKMQEWLQASGANLMAWGGEYGERLEMREGVALNPPWTGTNRAGFEQTDPDVVARQAETFLKPLLTNSAIKIHLLQPGYDPNVGQRQDTFQFMTREGTVGVLQILNTEDNPHGVKIRYKLVRDATAKQL